MDPREAARREKEQMQKDLDNSFNNDKLSYLPTFKDGEERILRILPPKEVLEYFLENPSSDMDTIIQNKEINTIAWRETWQHFKVGIAGDMLPCLKGMNNKPCPVCEAVEEDIESENAAIKQSAKDMRSQHKWTFPVEWRGHEEEGPYLWSISKTWANRVMAKIANPDYTLLYDPYKGHDLRVTRHGTGQKETSYDIEIRPDETFLYPIVLEDDDGKYTDMDFEKTKAVVEVLPNIHEFMSPSFGYEDYKRIVNGELSVADLYKEQSGEGDTEFNPEEIEKEEEEKPIRRRRRR